MKTEIINGHRVKAYDNGGDTFDRYTAVYLDMTMDREFACCRSMSANPFHPQGFVQFSLCADGRHLGKRIAINDLPADCQKLIDQDTRP